tara:strand:- start:775 stop:936 length:162 start_codon:yes stop_codon:yes gene_type:complete
MGGASILDVVDTAWPVVVGFITLVVVLAKMHGQIDTLREKVKVLFDMWNHREK